MASPDMSSTSETCASLDWLAPRQMSREPDRHLAGPIRDGKSIYHCLYHDSGGPEAFRRGGP